MIVYCGCLKMHLPDKAKARMERIKFFGLTSIYYDDCQIFILIKPENILPRSCRRKFWPDDII